jgi:hypothetical protein
MQTFEVATSRPIIWQLQSSDFDIFNLFDTDDIELSQLCEKMNTENNSCKLFGMMRVIFFIFMCKGNNKIRLTIFRYKKDLGGKR